jgi:surface carbohydrate biosynthesis protein
MNIYIHVEISVRELDSKLLLATIAASKGHQVIVSDLKSILSAINKNILPPGIFHTKSLTPTKEKIIRHQLLKNKGFLITSIDEEAGLDIPGYEQFSKTRYSDRTMEQSSMVFTWGTDDFECLKKNYPKYKSKIFKTGSPRVDLWTPSFSTYWKNNDINLPKKPFLLVSSNMGAANNNDPYYEVYNKAKSMDYFNRDPKLFDEKFGRVSEQYLTIASFIKAITFISKNNNDYDIVVRPHPAENIEAWKTYLKDVPNVYVIRKDSISFWVDKCFAVMHNGCTTAFEATVSKKPLISYMAYEQKYSYQLTNKLGKKVKSEIELLETVNQYFKDRNNLNEKKLEHQKYEFIQNKILIDKNELAAEKIVKLWETLYSEDISKSFSLNNYKLHLTFLKIKAMFAKLKKNIFRSKFLNQKKDNKFASLNKEEVKERISILSKLLRLDQKITCEILSDKVMIIKKN